MSGLRSRRPTFTADAFISGADAPAAPEPRAEAPPEKEPARPTGKARAGERAEKGRGVAAALPWQQPNVRDDVTKAFNLRLPEPMKLQLDFIRSETRISVHEFIMAALAPAVEAEITRLTKRS